MAQIEFIELAHSYSAAEENEAGRTYALRPMSVTWNDGGAYALLGPSGCGKTTLLNIISGLVTPTEGRVLFDDEDVTSLPPERRNIAQVFQFPVIYDTMTVYDNLAFPLRNRAWGKRDTRKRVEEIADLLELTEVLKDRASGLSADAKQKISLGRGLVRPDVAAILFDEPLTVIDPHLKWLLRRKLKQIHQQLKLSLIYVTHDQIEALTFADTIIVMTHGEIVQSGSAQALFENPEHAFVGHFIGSPGMNFLPCKIESSAAVLDGYSIDVGAFGDVGASIHSLPNSTEYKLGIRPEFIECFASRQTDTIEVAVQSQQSMGAYTLIRAYLGHHSIWIKSPTEGAFDSNTIWIRIPPKRAILYANDRRVGS